MSFRQRLNRVSPERETVVTIGVFDGVHRGHCHLLQRLIAAAGSQYEPTVLTFANHPVTVLQPGREVSLITTLERKESLIRAQGIDHIIALEFTPELAQATSREFVSLLIEHLGMKGLVIGSDFALGRNREGTCERLMELGKELGFFVEIVEPLLLDGLLVKSRVIRQMLTEGDVAISGRLLGAHLLPGRQRCGGRPPGQDAGIPHRQH